MTAPMFARLRAQAFASVGIQTASTVVTEACPLSFAVALGTSCDRIISGDGTCDSVRDGENALVQCLVRSGVDASNVYDVNLLLEHSSLPRLAIRGALSSTDKLPVRLQVTTPEQGTIDAQCLAEAIVIEPGIVRLRLGTCTGEVNGMEAAGCDVSLSAGFENCAR
jgi:hypothetical protein